MVCLVGGEMPKFSILTSVHVLHELKQRQLERCQRSLVNQSFQDYEWIVVDDGSTQPLPALVETAKLFKQPHLERIVALSEAMKQAKGEWFLFLDSDDELMSYALEAMNKMIEKNPEYKMFNFGSLHVNRNYKTRVRDAFKPVEKEVGHEIFGGGNIVNGTFLFHRSLYDELGGFPSNGSIKDPNQKREFLYMTNPWDFSIAAQEEFPEIKYLFLVTSAEHPNGLPKELGNPWGNDFYIFYKYTRQYHSRPYDIPLLIVHHEGKHAGEEHYVE